MNWKCLCYVKIENTIRMIHRFSMKNNLKKESRSQTLNLLSDFIDPWKFWRKAESLTAYSVHIDDALRSCSHARFNFLTRTAVVCRVCRLIAQFCFFYFDVINHSEVHVVCMLNFFIIEKPEIIRACHRKLLFMALQRRIQFWLFNADEFSEKFKHRFEIWII